MAHLTDATLIGIVCFFLLLCCFFSLSETGMMALNRYQLRHKVRQEDRIAKRVLKLLETPDRLLGLILIGSTFANTVVSATVTVIAMRIWGEESVGIAMIILTFLILIFGEIAPKTVAALHPLRVAYLVSGPVKFLLIIFYPLVWFTNKITNGFLRIFGVKVKKAQYESISSDELRTLVHEAGAVIPTAHKTMLLSLLDLEKLTVEDIMVPKGDILGIDLDLPIETIINLILHSPHLNLPVYQEHIDNVKGVLRMRDVIPRLNQKILTKENILQILKPAYFIPESTPLNTQLLHFKHEKERCGFVVDEYGDIQGWVTIEDILEEIVGEFSSSVMLQTYKIELQEDGSYIIDAGINLRDLNKKNNWYFPTTGPKTLSGLIIEKLEFIPPTGFCLKIENYHIEILSVDENIIGRVKISVGGNF